MTNNHAQTAPGPGHTNNPNEAADILNGTLELSPPPEGLPKQYCLTCYAGEVRGYQWRSTTPPEQTKMVFWCQSNLCGYRHWVDL